MWFYIIAESVFWVFAIMGFIELLQRISNGFFVYGRNRLEDISVYVTIRRREDKAEYILRSLIDQLDGITTKRGGASIFVVDAGMDEETFDIVAAFCEDHEQVELCKRWDAVKTLSQKLECCGTINKE